MIKPGALVEELKATEDDNTEEIASKPVIHAEKPQSQADRSEPLAE